MCVKSKLHLLQNLWQQRSKALGFDYLIYRKVYYIEHFFFFWGNTGVGYYIEHCIILIIIEKTRDFENIPVDLYWFILLQVKIVGGGEGTCEAEFCVEKEHTNVGGLLHGGFSACLVDSVSTMALLSHSRQVPGVSVNLNVT